MRLKLFHAPAMAEAMREIRAALGPEALILGTRRVAGGVEVTAALEPVPESEPAPLTPAIVPAAALATGGAEPPADALRQHALAWHGVPSALAARLAAGPLAFALSVAFRFQPLRLAAGDAPLLLAGPPGAGKTLTCARLATRLVMAGAKPMVITADGRRAGAIEQLAAFTRLLGLNLLVASQPATLARAIARREEGQPVLIDAPGCDAFDPAQRRELEALGAAADAAAALVLPAGLDPAEAADQAGAHAEHGVRLLVATRLDSARRLGAVLAAAGAGLALAEAGIGPGAADGLVRMTPELLAERLLRVPVRPAARPAAPPALAPRPPLTAEAAP